MDAAYAELAATSNFSFLRGASHPDELVTTAKALGMAALGIADRNSVAGVVRAHRAAKTVGLRLLVGGRLVPRDGPEILCYPRDRDAWGRLCRLLTLGKRRAAKGECDFTLEELLAHAEGQELILLPPDAVEPAADYLAALASLAAAAPGRLHLGARWHHRGDDARRLRALQRLAQESGVPLVALGDVLMHHPARKPLADVLLCIREGCTLEEAGWRLEANAERHLKPPADMARLFRSCPEALARSLEIAERCRFSLDELRYEYPQEVAADSDPQSRLEALVRTGAQKRYPRGVPAKVEEALRHELGLIAQLGYAPYFLTVHDVVAFARSREILCQGRGSAANSAVCFCLGITAVDPETSELLFERFVSPERGEPPDIDVDFEHERREEVIQHIYEKYGRERAGLTAIVVCYRARGALRDVGKVMGLAQDVISALAGSLWGWGREAVKEESVRALGLDPRERRLALTLKLAEELMGFPRHLSQHVGGFVMTRDRLDELVPIENAAMADRTVIEWDKDDIDALGILKVDVLALGMLTCLRKGFELIRRHYGRSYGLAEVPQEDPKVYEMLSRADSLGVFQVESRAQMSMLPRLQPRTFYDLVIEVAIVRPGPIQGDMVHPYLRRRRGQEAVDYPSDELRRVLERTLGVPLFQEQAMQIAIVAAGFTATEADQLRRAMAAFRRNGEIEKFRERFVAGMVARGYEQGFAERCFRQIEGFSTYGFPESHAASFALLVYVSAWMKHHYPEVFACALLNSQPMGFYAPAQIVRDAREHGVEVLPVDVNRSEWDCTLEPGGARPALRLGLRQVKGLGEAAGRQLVNSRGNGYPDPLTLWRRAGLQGTALEALARGDAFRSQGLDRRAALWAVKGLPEAKPLPLFAAAGEEESGREPEVALPGLSDSAQVMEDYAALRLSLKAHPLSFLREGLQRQGFSSCAALGQAANGETLAVAGLVLVRQRPGSSNGVIFATLEDESGIANLVVWPDLFARQRRELLAASLLGVWGRVQREGEVIHLISQRFTDLTAWLDMLREDGGPPPPPSDRKARLFPSRDFH
ncbi:error-prone DNA polymerase [Aquibaculum arenosum]|uniref:Error-prone DNA polymerase n=1 Tax=Aquibaculum arenosum TaxID=3032591 RepID=A0ABT5YNW1_9PROT|nr:error-prone DNA polymerase [Fodinicurvata sp. CAU 1616]MDF2096649.1 error-prone DNA polymerase [Fodinicurvata sp. CAU 1616]